MGGRGRLAQILPQSPADNNSTVISDWIYEGTPAYGVLEKMVLDKWLLKDISFRSSRSNNVELTNQHQ